eukprot:GHVU01179268.1.p1 GENE.GHVU01179268.1~~GHVU01179268.1.p1  ORF type:complete len:305 (+),score=26.45 GHVU01179268.1:880-1794(+)
MSQELQPHVSSTGEEPKPQGGGKSAPSTSSNMLLPGISAAVSTEAGRGLAPSPTDAVTSLPPDCAGEKHPPAMVVTEASRVSHSEQYVTPKTPRSPLLASGGRGGLKLTPIFSNRAVAGGSPAPSTPITPHLLHRLQNHIISPGGLNSAGSGRRPAKAVRLPIPSIVYTTQLGEGGENNRVVGDGQGAKEWSWWRDLAGDAVFASQDLERSYNDHLQVRPLARASRSLDVPCTHARTHAFTPPTQPHWQSTLAIVHWFRTFEYTVGRRGAEGVRRRRKRGNNVRVEADKETRDDIVAIDMRHVP